MIIHDVARNNHYRVNEHFDTQWNPLPDYNKDNPAHRFRAFGGTPGHWIEWGRLMLHIHAALEARCEQPPAWLLEDAKGLFNATVRDAWAPDGADGIVYTVDWEGNRWSANVYVGLSSKQWVRPTRSTPSLAIASMKPGIKHGGSTALST